MSGLVLIKHGALASDTKQTVGMVRREAISGSACGAVGLWMGETRMPGGSVSSNHHHGKSESAIYVVSGHPVFTYEAEGEEVRLAAGPGDYIYVPAWVAHREENMAEEEAIVVVARTTQEAIVVNLDT